MDVFLNEIIMNEELKTLLQKDTALCDDAKRIAEAMTAGETVPDPEPGMLPIYVLGYLTDYVLAKNAARGIDRAITIETLKDVNVWVDNYITQYGKIGLEKFDWLRRHYTGDLFKLGRLQFRLEKSLDGVPSGEKALETHIQQGEPLTLEGSLASFAMAKEFFARHFPEEKPEYFMCDSWLLNPNLADLLDESSNIVRFMRLWTIFPFPSDDSALAIERIFGFGFEKANLSNAPEDTSLQRKLKAYLLSGGNLDITAGYRKI